MIRVTPTIAIAESELEYHYITASGPGGQNVNKVATAVQLRFDVAGSPSLPDDIRRRLTAIAGKGVSGEGVLIIRAQRYRSQDRNRDDATHRLMVMIQKAAEAPRQRRATGPTPASQERRLESKRLRGQAKQMRGPVGRSET
jgi:ribosome-associated protein